MRQFFLLYHIVALCAVFLLSTPVLVLYLLKISGKCAILLIMRFLQHFFTISVNQLWVAVAVLALACVALGFFLFDLRKKWFMLFGSEQKNEEALLKEILERLGRLEMAHKIMEPRVAMLEKISQSAVQKVAFRRFNPFENTGGDQSFTLVLLDRENNGVAVSSLYTREGARVYGKEVSGGKAKQLLSDEEQSLLQEAVRKNY